ncbi:peptide ABC transporter substrate-binding protein [Planctomycetes bacterium K23_9]|uniref:Oligopeptide-binding protein OppA n=1 Tax=Stieleria marina TaxID=1930275 RepID=A0A517P332_9BACT|nr:Oligopeptide-binding protein OppA precursor [Planctomycetes bacterium K23_9]
MPPQVRRAFLIVAAVMVVIAVAWASFFETLPPADFSLQSGTDPKTLDPHRATGNIESRLIFAMFNGLLQMLPEGEPDPESGLQPMTAQPAMAKSYDVSDSGRTYTFHLRDDIFWTDGSPVTSHDFAWSWQRMLHPGTACEYTFQLHGVPFAKEYSESTVKVGDKVEVELWDRPDDTDDKASLQNFPRGTMRYGILREIEKPDKPPLSDDASDKQIKNAEADWQETWVYHIDVAAENADGSIDWDGQTKSQTFVANLESAAKKTDTQRCHAVMIAFGKLGGLETPDYKTFVVHLKDAIPYFPNLVAYYPTFPVNKNCVEEHGSPLWTKAENIVTNGPYKLQERRLRDRLRLLKNEDYFGVNEKGYDTIDFLSMEGQNTAINMYETDQISWVTDPPAALLGELIKRDDFVSAPQLSIYYYQINIQREPLDDVRVRRAIAMAIDRKQIVEQVMKTGQLPAFTLVPPGIAGYESAKGPIFDVEAAQKLLVEAGFPGGRGIPKITLLYNTTETHRAIAEVIQQQLQNNLNVKIELQNMEWGSYLDKRKQKDYEIARAGWIADYPDPNTFLDMWITDGPQNDTNWSNQEFDRLLQDAGSEGDPAKRMKMLQAAEQIFIDEMPVIPIYFYTSLNMIKNDVEGFFPTAQDLHPIQLLQPKEGVK